MYTPLKYNKYSQKNCKIQLYFNPTTPSNVSCTSFSTSSHPLPPLSILIMQFHHLFTSETNLAWVAKYEPIHFVIPYIHKTSKCSNILFTIPSKFHPSPQILHHLLRHLGQTQIPVDFLGSNLVFCNLIISFQSQTQISVVVYHKFCSWDFLSRINLLTGNFKSFRHLLPHFVGFWMNCRIVQRILLILKE
jgi:hypothetical protein